jgi:hypothetical protein
MLHGRHDRKNDKKNRTVSETPRDFDPKRLAGVQQNNWNEPGGG